MKFKVGHRVRFIDDDGTSFIGTVMAVDQRGHPPWVSESVPDDPEISIRWDDGEWDLYFEHDFEDIEVIS